MKYYPKYIDEIEFHQDIIKDLKDYLKSKNFPNLLLYGPPGTGKTTIATCFARSYLKDHFSQNFMELNASNDRGINTIRNQVLDFVTHKPFNNSLKIMLLDEADYLTLDAQAALRRILEKNYKIARFILTCNHLNRIEPPIKSRCKIFRFKQLSNQEIRKIALNISKSKNLDIPITKIETLVLQSKGDIRYILNNIQSNVLEDSNYIKVILEKYINNLKESQVNLEYVDILTEKHIDSKNLIEQIFNLIWNSDSKVQTKLKCIYAICEFEENLINGCNLKSQFLKLSDKIRLAYSI
jgi:replication factor C small subunit